MISNMFLITAMLACGEDSAKTEPAAPAAPAAAAPAKPAAPAAPAEKADDATAKPETPEGEAAAEAKDGADGGAKKEAPNVRKQKPKRGQHPSQLKKIKKPGAAAEDNKIRLKITSCVDIWTS